jgi:hypothetical protein
MTISLYSKFDDQQHQYSLYSEDCIGCGRHSDKIYPALSGGRQVQMSWCLCLECHQRMTYDKEFTEFVLNIVDNTLEYFENKLINGKN